MREGLSMTFWETFVRLCDEHKTKPNPVASELGISSGSVSQWKTGSIPSAERLLLLADYFGCSIDYLLGRTNNPSMHQQDNNFGNIVNSYNNNSPLTVSSTEQPDEMQKEFGCILSNLTIRERIELMTMIYKFADEHKK
jgi:transcriptional regulator with XRE-family HTH domain